MLSATVKLSSRLPAISAQIPVRVEAALKLGREQVAQEARSRVPVATGTLRDAIHVDGNYVLGGDDEAFYGHLVEFGTVRTPARPFLVPSLYSQQDTIIGLAAGELRRL